MKKVIVIGGGASGMMAAYASAKNGNQTILLEKNEKLGKKIYITGKGRCNLTNDIEALDFFNNVVSNPKFLYSSIFTFPPAKTIKFFEDLGLSLIVERGKRVFPSSNKASDVTKFLEKELRRLGVQIFLNTNVEELITENNEIKGVVANSDKIYCDSVIIATGGASYQSTGSTGDGYKFARNLGHKIVNIKPSLVGVELTGSDFVQMQGLSLKNVSLTAYVDDKAIYSDFGEMFFTHFGVSGPIILSASCFLTKKQLSNAKISIDLKPALTIEQLENKFTRLFAENNTKNISSVVRSLVPSSMVDVILRRTNLSKNKKCSEIRKDERRGLINTLKNFDFKIKKLRPIEEAIITSGGVSVKDINPKTLESKIVKNLYFCGETIDVDAFTGGFNLQIAFSTGYLAGLNA